MHALKRAKQGIKRLWQMLQPATLVATRMRTDWNDRASANPRHFVATLREDWTDEEFFESGRTWIRHYVLPDLELICRGRSPSELRILELGCGAGRMTRGFSEIFGFVDAVDVSSKMIEKAEESLSDCRNVALHINDGMKLSEFAQREYFDFMFSAIVFQHIPRRSIVRGYIREAARLLRSGCVFKFQAQGVPMKDRHPDTWVGVGFSESEMRTLASRCGFLVHSMTGAGTQYFWVTLVKR